MIYGFTTLNGYNTFPVKALLYYAYGLTVHLFDTLHLNLAYYLSAVIMTQLDCMEQHILVHDPLTKLISSH